MYAHSIFMCQKARQSRRPYYTSIARQSRRPIILPLQGRADVLLYFHCKAEQMSYYTSIVRQSRRPIILSLQGRADILLYFHCKAEQTSYHTSIARQSRSPIILPLQGRAEVLLYFHCFLSSNREASKNMSATQSSQKEERWHWKIKSPSRCCWRRSGFLCGLVGCNEKETTDKKLENACISKR